MGVISQECEKSQEWGAVILSEAIGNIPRSPLGPRACEITPLGKHTPWCEITLPCEITPSPIYEK